MADKIGDALMALVTNEDRGPKSGLSKKQIADLLEMTLDAMGIARDIDTVIERLLEQHYISTLRGAYWLHY